MTDNWLVRRIFHWWFFVRRSMTLGVRVALENEKGEFLLVRHTYVSGWYLPGGGVERGETFNDAAIKEVWEETGIRLTGNLRLFGLYYNVKASPRDHVALYHIIEDHDLSDFKPNSEIAEARFFAEDAMPADTTKATHRRIKEIRENLNPDTFW